MVRFGNGEVLQWRSEHKQSSMSDHNGAVTVQEWVLFCVVHFLAIKRLLLRLIYPTPTGGEAG